MDMRGIAREKASAHGKLADVTGVYLIRRKPVYAGYVELEFCIVFYLLFDLFIQHIAFVLCEFFGKCSDDAKLPLAGHRKKCQQLIFHQKYDQSVVTIFPIDIDICHVKHSLEGSSLKGQTERMADQALCTVAADQVFGIYSFR